MKIKLGISLILAVLVFIFISQNTATVRVNFMTWSVEMSIVLLVFIILGAGIMIGWLLNSYLRFAHNRKKSKRQKAAISESNVSRQEPTVASHGDREKHG